MANKALQSIQTDSQKKRSLEAEFARQLDLLRSAEAELAEEQASLNAFRMHARLRLDRLVESYLDLREEKQRLLTRLALLEQAQDMGVVYDEDDPFWRMGPNVEMEDDIEDDLMLPTATPNDRAAEKRMYRDLARRFHPDLAKTAVERAYRTSIMSAINTAYEARDIDALFDLSGELAPEEMAELRQINTAEIRKLRETIMRCRHRRRKLRRELAVLRQENTAKLWRRAQELEALGEDWWTPVRREIEAAIERREPEMAELRRKVESAEFQQQILAERQALELDEE